MVAKRLLLLILLEVGAAEPLPDPVIYIDVQQKVGASNSNIDLGGCTEANGFFHYPPNVNGQCLKYINDERHTQPDAISKCQSLKLGGKNLELAHPLDPIGLRRFMMKKFGDKAPDGGRNTCWLAAIRKPLYFQWPDNGAILSFSDPLWYADPRLLTWQCMRFLMQTVWLQDKPKSPYESYPCDYPMYTLCEYKP